MQKEENRVEFLKKEIKRLEKVEERFLCFGMDDLAQTASNYKKSLEKELEKELEK